MSIHNSEFNGEVDLQISEDLSPSDIAQLPTSQQFELWTSIALRDRCVFESPELTIRIVCSTESQELNSEYRGKNKPTNVLSFPFEVPPGIPLQLLGDLIISAEVVEREAAEQHKQLNAHWAHMVIHGCLHLMGYDHIKDEEAEEMEAIEIQLLAELGFPNPYTIEAT